MILLLHQDLANLFRHRVFAQRFALLDAIALVANGFVFIIEIKPKHLFRILRGAHRLRSDCRHLAEIVNLPRNGQGVIELLLGVVFKLRSDVHILGAAEHLGIDNVGDDGLIFAGKVFVQELPEAISRDFGVAELGSTI